MSAQRKEFGFCWHWIVWSASGYEFADRFMKYQMLGQVDMKYYYCMNAECGKFGNYFVAGCRVPGNFSFWGVKIEKFLLYLSIKTSVVESKGHI